MEKTIDYMPIECRSNSPRSPHEVKEKLLVVAKHLTKEIEPELPMFTINYKSNGLWKQIWGRALRVPFKG